MNAAKRIAACAALLTLPLLASAEQGVSGAYAATVGNSTQYVLLIQNGNALAMTINMMVPGGNQDGTTDKPFEVALGSINGNQASLSGTVWEGVCATTMNLAFSGNTMQMSMGQAVPTDMGRALGADCTGAGDPPTTYTRIF